MAQGLDAGEPGETPGGQERPGPRGLGRQLPPGLWTAALTQPPAATFPHCQNRLPSLLRMVDQLLRPSALLFWAVFSGYSFSSRKKQEQCLCGKGTLELLLHTAGKKRSARLQATDNNRVKPRRRPLPDGATAQKPFCEGHRTGSAS